MGDIKNIRAKFTETYNNFKWKHGSGESKSGEGSSLDWTHNYRKELEYIIQNYNIKKILDCSCGDWNWMRTMSDKFLDYTGIDIVEKLIESNKTKYGSEKIRFFSTDMLSFIRDSDVTYDLVICRHTFEHLPDQYVLETINEIVKKTKYCLFSSQEVTENKDINFDGYTSRNINLRIDPYKKLLGDSVYQFIDSPVDIKSNPIHKKVFGLLFKL